MGTLRGLSGLGAVFLLLVTACDSGDSVPDGGPVVTDSGTGTDSGTDGGEDAGTDGGTSGGEDAGSDGGTSSGDDGGTVEPLACERTRGVCQGAARARVDGGYEPVCTARSYGSDFEESETRCDGLDNDCDGVVDPTLWSRVAQLRSPVHGGAVSSLRVDGGVLVAVADAPFGEPYEASIHRLDLQLALQGTSRVPLEETDAGRALAYHPKLLRTGRGLVLGYAMKGTFDGPGRMYIAPLDESGAPAPQEDGGTGRVLVLDSNQTGVSTRVGASPDGSRLLFVWGEGASLEPRRVMGVVADAEGQVLVGPRQLFAEAMAGGELFAASVLWLRNGEVAVAATEYGSRQSLPYEDLVRVQRFDGALDPVGEERNFRMGEEPLPALVDLGPAAGGPLESTVLVMRRQADDFTHFQLQAVSQLFDGGTPRTLVETPRYEDPSGQEVPWFGAYAGETGLRLAWLTVRSHVENPNPTTYSGLFWTWEEGGSPVNRHIGPERLPLDRYAQWVLMEQLAPRQQGALIMTSAEAGHFLEAVRYCVP